MPPGQIDLIDRFVRAQPLIGWMSQRATDELAVLDIADQHRFHPPNIFRSSARRRNHERTGGPFDLTESIAQLVAHPITESCTDMADMDERPGVIVGAEEK